jgi:ubiquinone/menaquinone biosynthesis C-methylase UbiE
MHLGADDQTSVPEEIRRYYELGLEKQRLTSAAGQLEFLRTQEIIQRYLPHPPGVVLDIGGGPGMYACWMALNDYEVHLVDPVPLHVEQAREASARQPSNPVNSFQLGDARQVAFMDKCVDGVLMLGPLYHIVERAQRITALEESRRVLKEGGVLIAVAISRFASTLAGLIEGYLEDLEVVRIIQRDLQDGQHRNPTAKPSFFTTSFFHHPRALEQEIREAGFSDVRLLAVEGPAVFLQDLEEQWKHRQQREMILEAVRWLEGEPSVMGVTGHLAAIAIV